MSDLNRSDQPGKPLSPYLDGKLTTATSETGLEPRTNVLAAESPFLSEAFLTEESTAPVPVPQPGWGQPEGEQFNGSAPVYPIGPGVPPALEFDLPKTALIVPEKLKIAGIPEVALAPGAGGQFEGFFREPPTSYNGWVTVTGKVQIEEGGNVRAYDYALDHAAFPLTQSLAHVAVGGPISSSSASQTAVKKDGTFSTSTWIGYRPYLVRRVEVAVIVELAGGKKLSTKVIAELIDLTGFLAIVDPQEKRRPSPQSHLEFLASVRKTYHGGPRDSNQLQQLFDWLLYRNRGVKVLFELSNPEEPRLRRHKILYYGGEWIEIGHVLCGIEAMPKQQPGLGQNIPKPIRPELLVTWSGDLGSVIQEVYVKDFWSSLDTGATVDFNEYLVREASRSDLIGDIDGINVGAVYDDARSLAENLNAYYGKGVRRRYHDFIANTRNAQGDLELPLVPGSNPPKLSKQARQNIATHVHNYLVYFWTTGRLYFGTDPQKRKLVDEMVQVDSPEMNIIVDHFVQFLENGLTLERRQGVTLQPELESGIPAYPAVATGNWQPEAPPEAMEFVAEADYESSTSATDREFQPEGLGELEYFEEGDFSVEARMRGKRSQREAEWEVAAEGPPPWSEETGAETGLTGFETETTMPGEAAGLPYELESPPPPKGLHLGTHLHIPKSVPDGHAGAAKILDTRDLNPGFVSLISDDILADRRAGGMQTTLDHLVRTKYTRFLASKSSGQESARAGDRIRLALVDLSGAKLFKPDVAGWGSTTPTDGASVPKICALYGAHQVLADLNLLAQKRSITKKDDLLKAAREIWKKAGFTSLPRIEELFDFNQAADLSRPVSASFSADLKETITNIFKNNNKCSANQLISQLGFPYLGSLLWQSGLRHPSRGGLWLWGGYCCTNVERMKRLLNPDSFSVDCKEGSANGLSFRWKSNPMTEPKPVFPHNATALSVATYFTLLAQGRLVSDTASDRMLTTLKDACSFFWDQQLGGLSIDPPPTKCGIVGNLKHDVIFVKRTTSGGKSIAYVAAALTVDAADFPFEHCLKDLDKLIRDRN